MNILASNLWLIIWESLFNNINGSSSDKINKKVNLTYNVTKTLPLMTQYVNALANYLHISKNYTYT